jgi:hypothetical protein
MCYPPRLGLGLELILGLGFGSGLGLRLGLELGLGEDSGEGGLVVYGKEDRVVLTEKNELLDVLSAKI